MLKDYGLLPEPPSWAIKEGLPAPHEGETFIPYAERLGLRPGPLLEELTEQTIVLANARLATTLQRSMQTAFDREVDRLAKIHITHQRRRQLDNFARAVFGTRYRRRPIL